jgi:hypothetical protein
MPYLSALSKFRDDIRAQARLSKRKLLFFQLLQTHSHFSISQLEIEILTLCDNLRDNVLPELGVLLEDLSIYFFSSFYF